MFLFVVSGAWSYENYSSTFSKGRTVKAQYLYRRMQANSATSRDLSPAEDVSSSTQESQETLSLQRVIRVWSKSSQLLPARVENNYDYLGWRLNISINRDSVETREQARKDGLSSKRNPIAIKFFLLENDQNDKILPECRTCFSVSVRDRFHRRDNRFCREFPSNILMKELCLCYFWFSSYILLLFIYLNAYSSVYQQWLVLMLLSSIALA